MLDVKQTVGPQPRRRIDPMTSHAPHDQILPDAGSLPMLELPPAPFARPGAGTARPDMPSPHAVSAEPVPPASMPAGTGIDQLLASLRSAPPEAGTQAPATVELPAPHSNFHQAVAERRNRTERRAKPRLTAERRTFTSEHLAAPETGPADPRPVEAPPAQAPVMPMPLDTRMPELPEIAPLEPALPYQLPSRGVAADTLRSSRPSVAVTRSPFPSILPDEEATAEVVAEPAAQPVAEPVAEQPELMRLPTAQAYAAPALDAVFDTQVQRVPVGRLEPWATPLAETRIPDAGPAGPSFAPGAGLDPAVATAAAAPGAWYGGAVQVDDALLVWNAPGATAPLAPSVATMIAPQGRSSAPGVAALAAPTAPAATAVATTTLAPAAAASLTGTAAGTAAAAAARSTRARLLRLLAWIGLPAGAGVGLALAIDRFLL